MLELKRFVKGENRLWGIGPINSNNCSLFSLKIEVASWGNNDLLAYLPINISNHFDSSWADLSSDIKLSPSGVPRHTMHVEDTIVHGDDLVTKNREFWGTAIRMHGNQ